MQPANDIAATRRWLLLHYDVLADHEAAASGFLLKGYMAEQQSAG